MPLVIVAVVVAYVRPRGWPRRLSRRAAPEPTAAHPSPAAV